MNQPCFWWRDVFPFKFVMETLGTMGQLAWPLESRELCIYWDDVPQRNAIITREELWKTVYPKRFHLKAVHFGYAYPEMAQPVGRRDQRELNKMDVLPSRVPVVLDVDMDGKVQRSCKCADDAFCETCWRECIQERAVPLIEDFLENVMRLRMYFFVFSGRRGIHVWIMDPEVLEWTFMHRTTFMSLLKAHVKGAVKFDEAVTTQRNHTCKVPLGLHTSTHNFCHALERPREFNPKVKVYHFTEATPEVVQQSINFIESRVPYLSEKKSTNKKQRI